jgi:hypothetical protein
MGQVIDRAARLVGAPPSGDAASEGMPIVLDEVVAGLLDARFDVRESDAGFVLHGERELAEGTRTLLGKATPCVGRDRELRTLERMFDDCLEERMAQAMLVTAPAGTGKSRLAQEFLRNVTARHETVAIWTGRGDSLRAGSAFGMLRQPLRRACGIQDGEPIERRREKLVARIGARVPEGEQRRVAEFLGELIGTPFPDEESLPLRAARKDAQLMNDQMRAAFLDFLAAECAACPVFFLLEDLHWGDRPTVQFVDRALQELGEQALFVLALARSEVHQMFPGLWKGRRVQELHLAELGKKAVERLVYHVLGEGVGRDTIAQLTRLSEGNAFCLEELIRWAAEGRGADLPETVLTMVESRLRALDDEARRILRAASVFGEVFWEGGVASLLGGTDHSWEGRERLRELVDRELIVTRGESRFPGQEEYSFRNALLREGAYAMLTDEDRTLGHRLAGDWLERHGEQDMLVLAEHFEKGGDGARAGLSYLRAAEQATWGADGAAATAYLRRGLACQVPAELRVRLLGALCETSRSNVEVVTAVLPEAEELVCVTEPGSVPWAQAMCVRLNAAMGAGRLDDLLGMLRVLRETEITTDAGALAIILGSSIYFLGILGQLQEADLLMEHFAAVALAVGEREPSTPILWRLFIAQRSAHVRKDPWGGLEPARSAATLARSITHRKYAGAAELFHGMNLWYLGAYADAERTLKELSVPDEELSFGIIMRPFSLAWLLADRGICDEARVWASRLVASGRAGGLPFVEAIGNWVLAEVARRTGELDAAEAGIEAALAVLSRASPLDHPGALATLAAVRLAQGRPAEGLAAAEEGMAKAGAMGACSFFFRDAFLRLTHAECLEATGDHGAARTAISEARAWVLAVADKIGDPAYRTTFLENVPENRRTLELARAWLGEVA